MIILDSATLAAANKTPRRGNLIDLINFKNNINGILFISTYPCVSDLIEKSIIQDKLSIPLLHIFINNLEFKDEYSKKVEKFIDMIKDDIHE